MINSLSGEKTKYEREMINPIRKLISEMGYDLIVEEVPAGSGIADVVGIKTQKEEFNSRKQEPCFSPRCIIDFKILTEGNGHWMDAQEIACLVSGNPSNIRNQHLKFLIPYYLEEKKIENKYYYKKKRDFYPITQKAIVVEAKLRDWKRGFKQAMRYRSISNVSYLAILERSKHLVDYELFKRFGIGLICVNDELAYIENKALESDKYNMSSLEYIGEVVWNLYVEKKLI